MRKEFIEEMKTVLQDEQKRLMHALKNSTAGGKFPEYGDDEDDANEIADFTNNLSVDSQLAKELRDIRSALSRIDDGTYGIDKYTGEEIEEDRLRARPTSTSSVASKKTLTQEF
ncbi:MAG: TraR/DksA family transcriptional regulator [bacterium]|nr:TraR/DksA family transcriptional regulator [bacterium]